MNYIISIINPDSLSILKELCSELELPLSITMAGRGTAVKSMLDLLGIESTERRIVFTVASEEKTKKLIQAQTARLAPSSSHSRPHKSQDLHCLTMKQRMRTNI